MSSLEDALTELKRSGGSDESAKIIASAYVAKINEINDMEGKHRQQCASARLLSHFFAFFA